MATSTSFQENGQALGMPAPVIPTSAQAGIQQMMAAAMAGRNGPAGLDSSSLMMQYYQTMAEKCWGLNSPPGCLNSPPGSDSSSSAGSTSVQQSNNTIKNSPATSQQQGKRQHTGYSFWDRFLDFLHKFRWIVLSVHKLNKLGKFW